MTQSFDYSGLIHAAGICEGMTVDVVIDLFDVTKQCMVFGSIFDPQKFIDALILGVGNDGNVLIRAFSWDWCHGKGFNASTTPSQVGALGNVALKRKDFKRTLHPIYNWMVWGKDQSYLCGLEYSESFGEKSVFAWEEENDQAYQINFGNPVVNGLTLFHYIEKKVGVSYRYKKDFTDTYVNEAGKSMEKTYSMYVRDLNYIIDTDDTVYEKELLKMGIMKKGQFNNIKLTKYKIKELCKVYEDDILKNHIPSGVTLTPISEGQL